MAKIVSCFLPLPAVPILEVEILLSGIDVDIDVGMDSV